METFLNERTSREAYPLIGLIVSLLGYATTTCFFTGLSTLLVGIILVVGTVGVAAKKIAKAVKTPQPAPVANG